MCSFGAAQVSAFSTAYINVSFFSPESNRTLWRREEIGLYGIESPTYPVTGAVYLADPIHACANDTRFEQPAGLAPWIALVRRGNGCTFTYKINEAARKGASAAVIFNDYGTDNRVIQMSHPGTVAFHFSNHPGSVQYTFNNSNNGERVCVCARVPVLFVLGKFQLYVTCEHAVY